MVGEREEEEVRKRRNKGKQEGRMTIGMLPKVKLRTLSFVSILGYI